MSEQDLNKRLDKITDDLAIVSKNINTLERIAHMQKVKGEPSEALMETINQSNILVIIKEEYGDYEVSAYNPEEKIDKNSTLGILMFSPNIECLDGDQVSIHATLHSDGSVHLEGDSMVNIDMWIENDIDAYNLRQSLKRFAEIAFFLRNNETSSMGFPIWKEQDDE